MDKSICVKQHINYLLLASIGLSVLISSSQHYAQKQAAFETFTIGADYINNTNKETLHNYWDAKAGFEGYFSTPFYFGVLQTGVSYLPFDGKSEDYPDYKSFLVYVQWGYDFQLPLEFIISLNALSGLYQMSYENVQPNSVSGGEISEREVAAGLSSSLSYRFYKDWQFNFKTSYLAIFTNIKIELVIVSLGVSKSFNSPDWLKDFLE